MLNFHSYKSKIFKITRFFLVFALIGAWIFSGWPQVLDFPPEIQQARAGTVTYDTADTHVWRSPVGVTSVDVECWGAGGAGGGGDNKNTFDGGGGGGGGAYAKTTGISITGDTDYNVIVGAGGGGGTGDGPVGGDSYFNDGVQIKAKGGSGGLKSGGSGGSGGTGSTGSATYDGGAGYTAGSENYGGGGGESAGAASIGTSATSQTGASGVVDGGDGGNGGGFGINGFNGVTPGGGGGGAGGRSGGSESGGDGAVGKCILTWTTPLATTIEIKAQDYSTAVTKITFPAGAAETTVSLPTNGVGVEVQAFGGAGVATPVVTLVNTAAVPYNIWYNITDFSNSVVSTEHFVIIAKGGACANADAINQAATLDGANHVTTGTITTIAATGDGGEADERDLYLKIGLSAVAGKTGTSIITILGQTQ